MSTGKTPVTLGRQKLVAAKRDLLLETARAWAHGAATEQDVCHAAVDYTAAINAPLAKRTQYEHAAKKAG